MKPNKYLFIVGQLGNGGLERQLYYICQQLVEANNEVYVICWNCDVNHFYYAQFKALLNDKIIGYEISQSKLSKLKHLRKLIVNNKFSHIISFSAFTNFLTYSCAMGTNSKVFGSLRTSLLFYLKQQKIKALLNLLFPKSIIANSMAAIEERKKNKLIKLRTQFSLLQNVIDIQGVIKKSQANKITLNKNHFNTISVGNIREAKRLDRLVELFKYLKENHPKINIKHIHIGGGNIEWLNNLIKENKLEDYIVLKGQIDNVYPYIKESDTLLHFSDIEGASNVIMEAMCLSKPVVSTNCGDTPVYIKNNFNGFVYNTFDEKKFANSIIQLVENRDILEKMSFNSFAEINQYDIRNSLRFFEKAINTDK